MTTAEKLQQLRESEKRNQEAISNFIDKNQARRPA